ncbi:hypothetical protein ACXFAU_10825 [Paenibacillus glucanolyticus]|uniref:hypothetical protein n=1 Tax=Paenibacillus sp. LBL TaxID=2940563 RepID=UPI0024750527|nr:hypothetical protein [Paenibacillus sp. LBL]MDH6671986.1 hypothetical protein [Paenibacillus sp. LBL]
MILGDRKYSHSPVQNQSFIWIADYYDKSYSSEFDFETKKSNSFYDIDRDKLIRFGLIGEGSQVFFDVANGVFNINGHRIMISYATENSEYPLTGRTFLYNDIITYKDAVSDADLFTRKAVNGRFNHTITSYNIGYKKRMELEEVIICFQNILTIPFNEALYLQIKLSANQDLSGSLIIRRDGLITDRIPAPLIKDMAGIIHWEIK